jgi:hypothetical protein
VKDHTVRFSRIEPPEFLRRGGNSTDAESGRNSSDEDSVSTVLVVNVPKDMEDFLDIVLESQSGGHVVEFKPNKELGGVLVTFDAPEGLYHWANFTSSSCCSRLIVISAINSQ